MNKLYTTTREQNTTSDTQTTKLSTTLSSLQLAKLYFGWLKKWQLSEFAMDLHLKQWHHIIVSMFFFIIDSSQIHNS